MEPTRIPVIGTDGGPWRVLTGPVGGGAAADGPTNMAVDAALLEAVAAGARPTLRLYRWARPTLSFGRNQPARQRYDEAGAAERGIGFVRRPTGGQAVLHDDELTYAVVAGVGVIGRPRSAYHRVNEALVAGLRALGVDAALSPGTAGVPRQNGASVPGSPGGSRIDWTAACFRRPARGEVVAGGRKLVGSAQRLESRTILQHGSILVAGSQRIAEELLLDGPAAGSAGEPGWTTLEEVLCGRPGLERVATAIAAGFESVLGISLARAGLAPDEIAAVDRLRERFLSRDWTWRR